MPHTSCSKLVGMWPASHGAQVERGAQRRVAEQSQGLTARAPLQAVAVLLSLLDVSTSH